MVFNEPSKLYLTKENKSKIKGVELSSYSHICSIKNAIFHYNLAKQSFVQTDRIFKMAAPSILDSCYNLFSFSRLKHFKYSHQPFTNVLFCSKVGTIRNDYELLFL